MLEFFDQKNIFVTVLGYQLSHVEFWATITGGLAVWLSAIENVWSWIIGIVNVCLAFIMFYQIPLYPDMLLQIFFLVTNIMGFYLWKYPSVGNQNQNKELKISKLQKPNLVILGILGLIGTIILGHFSKNLHSYFPNVFSLPSAYPYADSFTTIMSIIATFLLMKKRVEAWWTWLIIDVLSTYIYFNKDIKFYALLYFVFCIIAVFGALEWQKIYRKQLIHS